MEGDERVRFCTHCDHQVYNISEMDRAEAEDLIANHSGRLCIRMYKRRDGRVMTKDCPVGVRLVRKRMALRLSLGAFAIFTVALGARTLFESRGEVSEVVGNTTPVAGPPRPLMGTPGVEVVGKPAIPRAQ